MEEFNDKKISSDYWHAKLDVMNARRRLALHTIKYILLISLVTFMVRFIPPALLYTYIFGVLTFGAWELSYIGGKLLHTERVKKSVWRLLIRGSQHS